MSKQEDLEQCIKFLRDTADLLEKGELGGEKTDPVGVLMMLDTGPVVFVPTRYVYATEKLLSEQGIEVQGYSPSSSVPKGTSPSVPKGTFDTKKKH